MQQGHTQGVVMMMMKMAEWIRYEGESLRPRRDCRIVKRLIDLCDYLCPEMGDFLFKVVICDL